MADNSNVTGMAVNRLNEIASNITSSIVNSTKSDKVSNHENPLDSVSIVGYLLGLILLFCVNVGPYLYFKFYKNKKITGSSSSEPKHAI